MLRNITAGLGILATLKFPLINISNLFSKHIQELHQWKRLYSGGGSEILEQSNCSLCHFGKKVYSTRGKCFFRERYQICWQCVSASKRLIHERFTMEAIQIVAKQFMNYEMIFYWERTDSASSNYQIIYLWIWNYLWCVYFQLRKL